MKSTVSKASAMRLKCLDCSFVKVFTCCRAGKLFIVPVFRVLLLQGRIHIRREDARPLNQNCPTLRQSIPAGMHRLRCATTGE